MIWIYLEVKRQFLELKRTDPRLDWNYPPTPPGKVYFRKGYNPKSGFNYCCWGHTKAEAAAKYNELWLKQIKEIQERADREIAELRKRLAAENV